MDVYMTRIHVFSLNSGSQRQRQPEPRNTGRRMTISEHTFYHITHPLGIDKGVRSAVQEIGTVFEYFIHFVLVRHIPSRVMLLSLAL